MPETFIIPSLRCVLARALPSLLEGKLIPLALFMSGYRLGGITPALVAALAWAVTSITYRVARRRRVSGLLVLSLVGLLGKTIVALATGSTLLYFLQPTLTTALVGCAFLGSVVAKRPLAERLVHDLWPLDAHWSAHADLRSFFSRLSVLWAFTSLVNAAVTIWLLYTQPLTTFVMVKSVLGPLSAAAAVVPSVAWLHRVLRRRGVRVVFSTPSSRGAPADLLVARPT